MSFVPVNSEGLILIVIFFSFIWLLSIPLKNVGIVYILWGIGFVLVNLFYFLSAENNYLRNYILLALISIWGLRLSIHVFLRNKRKEEDFRYGKFRKKFGPKKYWWFSFFQVFMLHGILIWIISAPLLAVHYYSKEPELNYFDYLAITIWCIGFIFEAGGDFQPARFKSNPLDKVKVLRTGFWKYIRHPKYFGDATVWWGYAFFSIAAAIYWPVISALIMILLLLNVSGVAMLGKTLKLQKPDYKNYVNTTSSFFPWFPKKHIR